MRKREKIYMIKLFIYWTNVKKNYYKLLNKFIKCCEFLREKKLYFKSIRIPKQHIFKKQSNIFFVM